MRELPNGTVTFLFTDIEGSTALLREIGEEGYAASLAEHRRKLRNAFRAVGGVEVDTQGDAFLYVFQNASEAVAAARDAHAALGQGRIRVRMGLHTGKPQVTADGYVGLDLHKGARIAAVGHGGQVLLSRTTRELVEADVLDLGEHRLKDFAEPVWIFQLGRHGFPPLRSIGNTNLPRPASSFVGRKAEVSEIVAMLRGPARLVTLTGPGGSGKTRLAIASASEVAHEYPNGVFWIDLAPLADTTFVLATIAQTLGAKEQLALHIGERKMLLVLDNFEHVVDAVRDISPLLRGCPNLSMLVTSRELLRAEGETGYVVPPLSQPEAIELFCARARLEPDDAIAALCARLDDMPLAVELAAARTTILSPKQMLERLSDRLDLLEGRRDAEARHQTLRATIAWSHELLSAKEQRLFAWLGVFAGGCTLDAAVAVCNADLRDLQSLVDKSLVQRRGNRFAMLETIHEYARERLTETGESAVLIRRQGERLVVTGEAFHTERDLGRTGSIESLEDELDNIRATLRATLDWPDDPLALRLVRALSWFWSASGRRAEGLQWITRALERDTGRASADRARALESATAFASFDLDAERTLEFGLEALALYRAAGDTDGIAGSLRWVGKGYALAGDLGEARRCLAESVSLWDQVGRKISLARTLGSLADIELQIGDLVAAEEQLRRSLEIAETAGADGLATEMLASLGELALARGDAGKASDLFLEALHRNADTDTLQTLWCVAGLAAVAALDRRVELAGRLWGAVTTYEEQLDEPALDPPFRRLVETALEQVESASFARAVTVGCNLTLRQAVTEATEPRSLSIRH